MERNSIVKESFDFNQVSYNWALCYISECCRKEKLKIIWLTLSAIYDILINKYTKNARTSITTISHQAIPQRGRGFSKYGATRSSGEWKEFKNMK